MEYLKFRLLIAFFRPGEDLDLDRLATLICCPEKILGKSRRRPLGEVPAQPAPAARSDLPPG
jgi:hypothetical protein